MAGTQMEFGRSALVTLMNVRLTSQLALMIHRSLASMSRAHSSVDSVLLVSTHAVWFTTLVDAHQATLVMAFTATTLMNVW